MASMYAKLFSRITESSLMEEAIEVRYTFTFLLAIADSSGNVVGTDVAIARRLNMPLETFQKCVEILGRPDPDSNSKEYDGKRVIPSEGERGYRLVNYLTYRQMKDQEGRREYMRTYMQDYRAKEKLAPVNTVNSAKHGLAQLRQAEGEGEEEVQTLNTPHSPPAARKGREVSERALRFADWFRTTLATDVRLSSGWREKWATCYDDMLRIDGRTPEQIAAVCKWAREDAFWSSNFQSPLKLRQRKDGVMYFDSFTEKMKAKPRTNGNRSGAEQPKHLDDSPL